MNSDQETCGFLPPTNTGFTDELRRQPSSSTTTVTGNNPRHLHLPRFTKFNIPPIDAVVTQDSPLAAALGGTSFAIPSNSFREGAAASPAVDTRNVISPTESDIITSPDQEHTTTSLTPPKGSEPPRRNPLRRTLSETISTVRKPTTPTGPGSSNRSESPQFKRLKTDIEQRCREVRGESGVTEEDVEDDNPSEAIVEQGEEEDKVRGEFVGFRRLDDGSLSIKLSCSCGNCFEFLRNRIGCFYKLTI